MNNLHELTKQLDVLTWNSRSVLNALIRSAMAAGSSKGFTVTRAGELIRLDKDDIYRISNFYEKWEAAGYPNDDETFNAILAEENACYEGDDVVTASLVKHAKAIWQDVNNKYSNNEYWIKRIYTVENPKWFTNTAPIPLNIRTPIYDEHLSTKSYDSYETYLFPNGYFAIDTLGFEGDNSEHIAGGKTWSFGVTDIFTADADKFLFGTQTNSDVMDSLYDEYKKKYAFAGGTDSYAFARNTFSYGWNNYVNGENSAILGGLGNTVADDNSVIIGGTYNVAASKRGAIGAGNGNMIACEDGFAANCYNYVGGYCYYFTRSRTISDTESECPPEPVGDQNGCQYERVQDKGSASDGTTLGSNQFFIDAKTVRESCIGPKCHISYGMSEGEFSPFDFKVGDQVRIFAIFIMAKGMKKACKSVNVVVTDIKKLTSDGIAAVDDKLPDLGYIVTVNKNLNKDTFTDLGSSSIYAGYVCRIAAENYPRVNAFNELLEYNTQPSRYSSAFGYSNIAAGDAQMVVGASNIELIRPRFIVGSGTSYIESDTLNRANAFVSAPNYTYMSTSNYIVSGVSTVTTAYIHGDPDYEINRVYDEDYVHGIEKYRGFYAYQNALTNEDEGRAVLRVCTDMSTLSIGLNGLSLYQPLLTSGDNQSRTVWNELYCRNGSMSMHSGSFLETGEQNKDNNWIDFYNNDVKVSDIPGQDHTITIWAKDTVGIHGHDIMLHANEVTGYIYVKSFALRIDADTRIALTAQPTEHNIEPYAMMSRSVDTIKDTGHVFTSKAIQGIFGPESDLDSVIANTNFNAFHVISSSHQISFDDSTATGTYDVAQLILPGMLEQSCNRSLRGRTDMPHPIVVANTIKSDDVGNSEVVSGNGYLYEELAYRSDIRAMATRILNNVVNPAYTTYASNCHIDLTPVVPNMTNACVMDSFLSSLIAAQDSGYHYSHTAVDVSNGGDTYPNVLIRAKSMTGAAGIINTLNDIDGNPEFFLTGVAINPCFRMTNLSSSRYTNGVAYLAFAPRSLRAASISSIYTANLASSSVTRTLYTSKFSRGTTDQYVFDLCDIWVTALNGSGTELEWKPLLTDFLVVCSGGRISVEFYVNGNTMTTGYFMPATSDGNPSSNMTVANTSSAPTVRLVSEPSGSLVLTIPLDPEIANKFTPVNNALTGASSMLYGNANFTDFVDNDGDRHLDITGEYMQSVNGMPYDSAVPSISYSLYKYTGPYLKINMGGWHKVGNITSGACRVHLEGVIYNAN